MSKAPAGATQRQAAREARWRAMWQRRAWPAWGWWPLSQLYAGVTGLRRWLYRTGLRQPTRLPCPVLVVGNVIAGGAGKTPTTIALVQHLQHQGIRVGIVSRGHGRSSGACQAVTATSAATQVGDEPLLMHRRTGAPVFVASARAQAGLALLQAHPDTQLIVCDDALQHLPLAHDWSVCVFDERGIGNGWLLPAGPLREPWPKPVNWTVQIHEAAPDTAAPDDARPHSNASACPVACAWPATRDLRGFAVDASGQQVALAQLAQWAQSGRPTVALAGIAKPEAFFRALQRQGLVLTQQLPLADHAPMDAHWLAQALPQGVADVRSSDAADPRPVLLCTEKDAVKLWAHCPHALAVPLQVCLPDGLLADITQTVRAALQAQSLA